MHELGVVVEVINTVENFAKANNIEAIDTIVLQIGEQSSMIPHYVEVAYPAVVDRTPWENTKLKIEVVPGKGFMIKEILVQE